jgi:chromosome segregation ATPase
MGSDDINTLLITIERIGVLNVALFVIIIALAFERVWNARNNKDANRPLTDAISALTAAVVSGDKRAEDNTRAWQRVVEANSAALERAADTKDKIAGEMAKVGEQVDALASQEVAHFGVTSEKLDATAAGVKGTEAAILLAVEEGTKTLSSIETKLAEIQASLSTIGSLESQVGAVTAQIGDVLKAVQALHAEFKQKSTVELPVLEKAAEA